MNRKFLGVAVFTIAISALVLTGCDDSKPQSASGVQKATVQVDVDPNTHMTVEQENVANRLKMDNKPGSVKHLYIISPETGQVLLYSTVKGKVTSSGKRLSPRTVNSNDAFKVRIGDESHYTSEVLEDDGTYGSSVDYIFWWDAQGRYHQHFFTGGQIIHISDYPIAVKNVVLNLELTAPQQDGK
jgi:hypothetical protein